MEAKKKPCDGNFCNGALQYIWKNEGGKRYCRRCWSAHFQTTNTKPTVRQKRISPRSSKRSKEEAEYSRRRIAFLARHPICQANLLGICTRYATEVHHKKGRIGSLLLDVKHWLAACHHCHQWIELNPIKAKEMGLSESRLI